MATDLPRAMLAVMRITFQLRAARNAKVMATIGNGGFRPAGRAARKAIMLARVRLASTIKTKG